LKDQYGGCGQLSVSEQPASTCRMQLQDGIFLINPHFPTFQWLKKLVKNLNLKIAYVKIAIFIAVKDEKRKLVQA